MSSEVFYRKWRPQTLAEVVGQESVTQTLCHAVKSAKVAHAYLFSGPRGTGKTSTARILAKAVNCPNQTDGEPCNACNVCRSIAEGRALDVVEIDAASNRGIDEVRSIREKVNYAPTLVPYKVYIIDEVHMLTEAASNALLKTLEEPPPHVIFILATTEPHKVLPTIMSRCQHFSFYRLSQEAMVSKLELICQREGLHIDPQSLRIIARSAGGSLRDAENILQQLIAYHGNEIGFAQVQAALGISDDSRVRELAKCILDRDVSAGLRLINRVNNDGIDLRQFNLALVEYLRSLLLTKCQCKEVLDVAGEDLVEAGRLVANVTLDYLLSAVKLFAGIDFRTDSCSTLPLELALVECALSSVAKPDQPVVTESLQWGESADLSQKPVGCCEECELPMSVSDAVTAEGDTSQDFDYLRSRWKEFIYSLRGEGSSGNLDALLRSACKPMALKDDVLVLGFYYPFHKEKIEDPKYRYLVERKLKEVFGKPYKIQCVLVDHEKEPPPQAKLQNPVVRAALERGARLIGEG